MKTLITSCLIVCLVNFFNYTSKAQYIFPVVNGDTVTLWETWATRNCGADYEMQINLQEHHLKWYQVDKGVLYVCLCVFDMAVTYGPLDPGEYTVDVYYTLPDYPDVIYEGSTSFTIDSSKRAMDGGVINQYQSPCGGGVGIKDNNTAKNEFRIYPVPVMPGQVFHLESEMVNEDAVIEIFTISGQKIFSKEYKGKMSISDQWPGMDIFPVPGIYSIRLSTSKSITTKLVAVL